MRSLQACAAACSAPVQAGQQVAYGLVDEFQARFQRCAARCQDKARESLPSGGGAAPSAKESERAQSVMAACLNDECGKEFLGKVPKLGADIEAGLKQVQQQAARR